MAIHIPEHLKGVTAGAMRQAKREGISTASGGLVSMEYVRFMLTQTNGFTRKDEPIGKFMSTLENAANSISDMTAALSKSSREMVELAKATTDATNAASAKMRDATDKLASAMKKFSETAGTKTFAEASESAQKMVDALERLAALQQKGLLDAVMKAMSK